MGKHYLWLYVVLSMVRQLTCQPIVLTYAQNVTCSALTLNEIQESVDDFVMILRTATFARTKAFYDQLYCATQHSSQLQFAGMGADGRHRVNSQDGLPFS